MSRFITTKANFTLRRKHKKGNNTTIYENDYTTINPMPNAFKQEYVIGDSNFKFTTRLGINGQKKHVRGKFIPNPSGVTDENGAWTIETIINSAITDETKIRLKPNYTSIGDFACYGSASKLVQGTIDGVILDFPAEMWLSDEEPYIYQISDTNYTFNEEAGSRVEGKVFYNEYGIDIISKNIRSESVYNPLRFLTLCGSSYVFIEDESDEEQPFIGFTVTAHDASPCEEGNKVELGKIADVTLSFSGGTEVKVTVFKEYENDTYHYVYTSGPEKGHIRPKKEIIEEYFDDVDDFTAVLLNRSSKPIYRSIFKTPQETDVGIFYDMIDYIWPTLNGGYNPDLSGPYYSYLQSLVNLGEFYDEYFTDNMWRSLTHEAIKALDWTYVSNSDGDIQEIDKIDTSRIEPIVKIYGRQFDDLKRYTDGIKHTNTITYDEKCNAPNYVLTDFLENCGWEVRTLNITTDKDIQTEPLYSGLSIGYTASDANNEFFRRLKLNSSYLTSIKGTRKGIDTILSLLGLTPEDYKVQEYVYVFSGNENGYTHFCDDTEGKDFPYPLAKDVSTINRFKKNFNINDPYGEYCGIPVAEVGYIKEDETGEGEDYSYIVPWFSYGKNYDDGLYFQMSGGWGKRDKKKISLEIASAVTEIEEDFIYDETQARTKFASNFDELLQEALSDSKKNDVFYVTDISDIDDVYTFDESEETTGLSHYFILENEELKQYLGYSSAYTGETKYGWRNIKEKEITEDSTSAGTLVLYLESIQDDTTGNNPHIGDGTYDKGQSYIDSMEDIFGYSYVNKNFIGIDDETCDKIKEYKFSKKSLEDNRKCWFFSDYDYNKKETKDGDEIEFREADVTKEECEIKKVTASTEVDIIDKLENGELNVVPKIGKSASGSFETDAIEKYNRTSELEAFNPEEEREDNEEGAANSVVNVKNLTITFNIPKDEEFKSDWKEEYFDYINDSVIPYLTQMIPSTSILEWKFEE